MPRSKRAAPTRLTEEDRADKRWDMNQQAAAAADDDDDDEQDGQGRDDDDDDKDGDPAWSHQAEGKEVVTPNKKAKRDSLDSSSGVVPSLAVRKEAAAARKARMDAKRKLKLEALLDASLFYVPVTTSASPPEEYSATLGRFRFRLADGQEWNEADENSGDEFWIYLSEIPDCSFVYWQSFVHDENTETKRDFADRKKRCADPDDFSLAVLEETPPAPLLECLGPSIGAKRRAFFLASAGFDAPTRTLEVRVAVTGESLFKLTHPSDALSSVPVSVKRTLNHLFKLDDETLLLEDESAIPARVKPDIDELYEVVKKYHEEMSSELDPLDPQHQSLLPMLRPYQKLAVRWMLSKEKLETEKGKKSRHVLYREVKTEEGDTLYYNPTGGYLVRERPESVPECPGGILADEMGLGKTVEVLSLMLCHHRENVPVPEWREPEEVQEPNKKLRRRRREPSPVEFLLDTPDDDAGADTAKEEKNAAKDEAVKEELEERESTPVPEDDDDPLMQVDGGCDVPQLDGNSYYDPGAADDDDDGEDTSDEEYVPRPTKSRKREREDKTSSTSESDSQEEEEGEGEPRPSTSRGTKKQGTGASASRARQAKGSSKRAAKVTGPEGRLDDDDDFEPDRPSTSKGKKKGKKAAAKKPTMKTAKKASAAADSDDGDDGDLEYKPRPSTSRSARVPELSAVDEDDPVEDDLEPPSARPNKSKGRKKTVRFKESLVSTPRADPKKKGGGGILKNKGKAKVINTDPTLKFDPASVLGGRAVTSKSTMSDMVLFAVVSLTTDAARPAAATDGASVHAIKKFIATNFAKGSAQHQKNCNKALAALVEAGKLVNTSGNARGASGSFKVNPDFENFDSRGLFAGKELDKEDTVIEEVITQRCYDGKPYNKQEVEAKMSKHKKESKPSTYQKLKGLYERSMAEMSEACETTEAYRRARRKWNGTFFDTKVEQASDYLECICGSELEAEEDPRHRVRCSDCRLWQHAACVKYDVADPLRGDYCCPHCWALRKPVPSGASLIVSPSSISYQWIEEIQKHIRHKKVRMLFYEGTKQAGYIQPRDLARYDIVITTYGVLQSETNYVDLPHSNSAEGRRFRNPKRFMAIPAPLPCVEWWRICLDEAQMIEGTTTKTAEMALRLSGVNRWCVTGTPIEKSLNDLQGLLLFLKVDPYSLPHWWNACLYGPYCRGDRAALERVLCKIMWRTAKKDVLNQIDIPKQTEEIHWLSFSPIEEHFYRRQHIECSNEAAAKIRRMPDLDARLSSIDRNTLKILLNPMLKLRQSCCHPQAVRGQFLNVNQKNSTMTMEELLDQMVKKAVLECEEFHRQFVAALNGLAGLAMIEEDWTEAAERYREVIRWVEEHGGKIKTDTLQRLHTLTNLAELLEAGHEGIVPTLRDDQLRRECAELNVKYLAKHVNGVRAAKEAVHPTSEQVEAFRGGFACRPSAWYVQIVDAVSTSKSAGGEGVSGSEDDLLQVVREEMSAFFDVANDREFAEIKHKYPNARMVMYRIAEKMEEVDKMRDRIGREMRQLESSPAESFVNAAVDCHLRQLERSNKPTCKLCTVHQDIELYEKMIFKFVRGEKKQLAREVDRAAIGAEDRERLDEKGVKLLDTMSRGNWADSEAERLLRALLKFARSNAARKLGLSQDVLDDGATHMKMIDSMKKEFRQMRILWRQLYDHVAGVDELSMSVMRLRLRFEDEPHTSQGSMKRKRKNEERHESAWLKQRDKIETVYILERHELPAQKLKLVSDKTISQSEFRKKFGQLQYLENLRDSDYARGNSGAENPEPCPICRAALGSKWSVLQCGHCYCVDCSDVLIKNHSGGGAAAAGRRSLRCPVCRSNTFHSEISYVNTKRADEVPSQDAAESENPPEPDVEVQGSLSTKMEAVVRTLLKVRRDDPDAKSLVFSTWPDVLDIVGSALRDNDIEFASLHAQGKFKRNLQKFKNRDDVKVLLLPITSGANGLNLIEASHVILIEPLLNPAQELQAVGRVHRIGQSKPTKVHKFVIRDTIEERMHNILSSYKPSDEREQGSHSTEENVVTVRDLRNIFVDGDD